MLLFFAAGYENVSKLKYISYGGYQMQTTDKYYTINLGSNVRNTQDFNDRLASTANLGDYVKIISLGNTDWLAMGATSQIVGHVFIVNAIGSGTGTFNLVTSNPALFEVHPVDRKVNSTTAEGIELTQPLRTLFD